MASVVRNSGVAARLVFSHGALQLKPSHCRTLKRILELQVSAAKGFFKTSRLGDTSCRRTMSHWPCAERA